MKEIPTKKIYLLLGLALLTLGSMVVLGWVINSKHLITLFTSTAPLGFFSVWSIVFSALLFLAKSRERTPRMAKIKLILAILIIINSLLIVGFCMTGFSPYIYLFPTGEFFDYFSKARNIFPHLAWAMAGFLMCHTTYNPNTKYLSYLETINFILLFIAIQGIVQSFHKFELVYTWLNNFAMPLPYAIALTLVNIGMIIIWGDIRSSCKMHGNEEDRQIKFFSTSMLTQAIMSSVFFGAMMLASQNELFLRTSLEKYVELKSLVLNETINHEVFEVRRAVSAIQSHISPKNKELKKKDIPDLSILLISQDYTAAKITSKNGTVLYNSGTFITHPQKTLPLEPNQLIQLIRDNGWHISFKLPLTVNHNIIGYIEIQKTLNGLTDIINSNNKFSPSEIKVICSPSDTDLNHCLASKTSEDITWTHNAIDTFNSITPIGKAFTNFNHPKNIFVVENLKNLNLKFAILVNADELEKDLRHQMYIALPIIGLFILFFIKMLNWHILPIFRRSINAEKGAIDSARMLSDSESRIQAIIDNIGECVIVFSEDGKIDSINQIALSAFNVPPSAIKDVKLHELFSIHKEEFQNFLYTSYGQWREKKCQRHDGTEFDAQLKFKDINARQKRLFIAIIRDITEQKIYENKLTQSEKVFRNSFDHAPIGMMVLNMKNKIIRVNQALCAMLGYNDTEILGLNIKALLPEHLRNQNSVPFQKLTEIGIKNYTIESPMLTKSGKVISTVSTMTLFLSSNDEDSFFVAQIQDVTMRQKYEAELRQTNDELQNKFKELKNHTRITEELNSMNGILQACLTIAEALTPIEKFAEKLFDDVHGAVYLSTPDTGHMELALRWGEANDNVDLIKKEDCWALRRSQPYTVKDPKDQVSCYHYDNAVIEGQICIPLTAQGELIGLMTLYSVDGTFKDHIAEISRLALSFADHIALSLSNIRLRERLQQQSIIDSLTGLYNRRYFDESMKIELSRAERKNQNLSLLIIDIDHFKKFNDTYGHDVGDIVLQEVSGVLKKNVRASDIACRMGGEEFAIIMPGTTTKIAHERAEVLRKKIQRIVLKNAGKQLDPITSSIGIATYPDQANTAKQLIESTDMALYAAKNQGRNRSITADSLTSHESLKGKPEHRYKSK
jgi:diguanylate cyclase (GGDEF)-like protein/PAS domain S-box-containing protein